MALRYEGQLSAMAVHCIPHTEIACGASRDQVRAFWTECQCTDRFIVATEKSEKLRILIPTVVE